MVPLSYERIISKTYKIIICLKSVHCKGCRLLFTAVKALQLTKLLLLIIISVRTYQTGCKSAGIRRH